MNNVYTLFKFFFQVLSQLKTSRNIQCDKLPSPTCVLNPYVMPTANNDFDLGVIAVENGTANIKVQLQSKVDLWGLKCNKVCRLHSS